MVATMSKRSSLSSPVAPVEATTCSFDGAGGAEAPSNDTASKVSACCAVAGVDAGTTVSVHSTGAVTGA